MAIKIGNVRVSLSNIGVAFFLAFLLLQSASFRKFATLNQTSSNPEEPISGPNNHDKPANKAIAGDVITREAGSSNSDRNEDDLPTSKSALRLHQGDDSNDLHHSSVPVLELLEWELQSLQKPYNQSCQVPKGVDEVCCLGTQSHTGKIKLHRRHLCDHLTPKDYQQLRLALEKSYLEQPQSTTTTVACDVCQIVETLRQHQLKFAFFGDSLTNQVEQGMVCELQRRNYRVDPHQVPYESKGDQFRSVIEYRRRTVRSPLWPPGETVVLDFMFQYRLPIMYSDEKERIANHYDVVIFNMGLHWVHSYNANSRKKNKWTRDTYGRQLKDFYNLIRQAGHVKLLAHRETTATHFDADGGDYSLARRDHPHFDTSSCVPLKDDIGNVSKWREPIVWKAAREANFTVVETGSNMPPKPTTTTTQPELYVIPYYDFTSQFWAFHPHREGPKAHLDCSHFCASPFLFQPIWRGIRWAMDREFG